MFSVISQLYSLFERLSCGLAAVLIQWLHHRTGPRTSSFYLVSFIRSLVSLCPCHWLWWWTYFAWLREGQTYLFVYNNFSLLNTIYVTFWNQAHMIVLIIIVDSYSKFICLVKYRNFYPWYNHNYLSSKYWTYTGKNWFNLQYSDFKNIFLFLMIKY